MPRLHDARGEILEAAQAMAQRRGYGGFSYRDIADKIGIKAASIHYHFASKDDLVVALARAYREEFFAQLQTRIEGEDDPAQQIRELVALVREVLVEDDRMCLCGMLAADVELLSEEARAEAVAFFSGAIDWLTGLWDALGHEDPAGAAADTMARLEGALLIARIAKDTELYDKVARQIESDLVGGDQR